MPRIRVTRTGGKAAIWLDRVTPPFPSSQPEFVVCQILHLRNHLVDVYAVIGSQITDGLKRSIVDIDSKLPPGAELILPVHDELLTLCREPDSGKVLEIVKDAVESAYFFAWGGHLKLPIAFKPNIIKNWSEKK